MENLNLSGNDEQSYDNGSPGWMKAVYRLGVPAAIALFLVWFLAGKQSEAMQRQSDTTVRIESKLDQHVDAMRRAEDLQKEILNDIHEHGTRQDRYQFLACLNSSTTEPARRACLNVK